MNEETFKDERGTFHYEPVVWGDWKDGDVVVFDGFTNNLHNHWSFNIGCTYPVADVEGIVGPISFKGEIPSFDWGFKFSRKVYDVVTTEEKDSPKQEKSLDNLLKELHNLKQEHNENLERFKKTFVDMTKVLKEINELAESLGIEIIVK